MKGAGAELLPGSPCARDCGGGVGNQGDVEIDGHVPRDDRREIGGTNHHQRLRAGDGGDEEQDVLALQPAEEGERKLDHVQVKPAGSRRLREQPHHEHGEGEEAGEEHCGRLAEALAAASALPSCEARILPDGALDLLSPRSWDWRRGSSRRSNDLATVKRYFFRDVARSMRSRERFLYLIAVARQIGGKFPRACNLCGYQGMFQALGHPPRYDALCPGCGSRERQRLIGLVLDRQPELARGRVIHFAPEASLAGRLRELAAEYRSADLYAPGCDLKLDIEAMALPDASADLFVVNHVLEHVDDRQALAELYRCLAPGGVALLSTPVVEGWPTTYEDPAIAAGSSDQVRLLHFGWPDHLRFYGRDIRHRIRAAGFDLSDFVATGAETARHGLIHGETIFIARKPAAAA